MDFYEWNFDFQITYRKTLGSESDKGDLSINQKGKNSIVWAIGKLARPGGRRAKKEPSFHHTYPRSHIEGQIDFMPTNRICVFQSW